MTSNLAERFQTLHEIVKAARHNLAPGPWDYLMGGTETETTLRACCATCAAWILPPRSSAGACACP
jgi:hypothetical protein